MEANHLDDRILELEKYQMEIRIQRSMVQKDIAEILHRKLSGSLFAG